MAVNLGPGAIHLSFGVRQSRQAREDSHPLSFSIGQHEASGDYSAEVAGHTKAINHVGNPRKMTRQRSQERFGPSVLRPFEPCAATVFGRQVPFSQVACATWKDNRLLCLCFPIHHPAQVLACESRLLLRRRERGGTLALLKLVPSFPGSR